MNIFNQDPVMVSKIISAEKKTFCEGVYLRNGAWRSHYNGLEHGFISLAYTLSGTAEYTFEDCTMHMEPGDITFLDNYSPFEARHTNGDHVFYTIDFVSESGFINEPKIFRPSNPEKYLSMYREASVQFAKKEPGNELAAIGTLYRILSSLKNDSFLTEHPQSKNDKIVFAMDYIKTNLSDSTLSVEKIAEETGISTVYLRSIFADILGMSPIKYIKNLRISTASDILISQEMSIAEISDKCGFANPSYFCREFKKSIGISPLQYKIQKAHRMVRVKK